MLKELLKEESQAIEDFYTGLKNDLNDGIWDSRRSFDGKIFEEAAERSQKALVECQLIESLDQQLRRLTGTIEGLKRGKRAKELEGKILEEKNFALLIPMVSEWRTLETVGASGNISNFVDEVLPAIIDKEIEKVLLAWVDDPPKSIDQDSFVIIEPFLNANPGNPLPGLFTSFPLSRLKVLLGYQEQLGHLQRAKKSYLDRLLNRFYDILSEGKAQSASFSVGMIESLVSEKMKFATRISCILEATNYFIKLHSGVIEISQVLIEKCGQILRQIRRDAKEERNGYSGTDTVAAASAPGSNATFAFEALSALAAFSFAPPSPKRNAIVPPVNRLSQIDSQLNEICLIIQSLSQQEIEHSSEIEKWKSIHSQLEEVYLFKGIQRAMEMDQIVVTSDFPVSSCVDDIFYILKASKQRTDGQGHLEFLIPRALKEFFLNVLRRHLESTVQALKPIQNFDSAPSRDLISTLVLLNNLVTVKLYWRQGFKPIGGINEELDSLFRLALQDGLYGKVLRREVVLRELKNCSGNGEEMFVKIHTVLEGIFNLFKVNARSLPVPFLNFIL